jgi:hypothetical protein
MCREITCIGDSDFGGPKEKFFNFASGEAMKLIRTVHLRVDREGAHQHES